MVSLILATLFTFVATVSHAATYYVATTGNNSNDGLTESTPKLTIAHCVSIMVEGDTCLVRGGTYTESGGIRFSVSGTAANPIKLANYPGERPIIAFPPEVSTNRILILHSAGATSAIGYITVEGFEVTGGWEGIRYESAHNLIIRNNWFHDSERQGILGLGGHTNLFEKNIISDRGIDRCTSVPSSCTQVHGMYLHGNSYVIRNNLIYWATGIGIVINGSPSSEYSAARHPSTAFAGSDSWIISDNTIAYNNYGPAINLWGSLVRNLRAENNILYENRQLGSAAQAFSFTSPTGQTGNQFRNNHTYALAPGGTAFQVGGTEGVHFTQSGNVTNVSAPAFVNAGTSLPSPTPDFRLTASAPVNIARVNEFLNNSTLVVGAHKTVANPTASITTNKITLLFSSITPIANLSTTGVSVACSGSACPGSPTVNAVGLVSGTDAQVEITIAGITGNACELANQNWTVGYDSAAGSWTNSDNIGPHPGLHQKIFSFTNLAVANNCTGSGPPSDPGTPHIRYKADEGTGTNLNDESANNLDGTLTGGGTWGTGHTGSGIVLTAQSGQYVAVPWGSGVNPTTQSFTVAFAVLVDAANTSLTRTYIGSSLGSSQRWYVSTLLGTWRLGIQGSNDSAVSELAVTPGWNYIVVRMDKDTPGSGAGTATLCVNRVCSTSAGGRKTYTSYTLASDLEWGRLAGIANGPGGTFDDFSLYTNVTVSPDDLYDAFTAGAPAPSGTFAQPAVQAQEVYIDGAGGNPVNLGTLMTSRKVIAQGAIAWLFQVHCTNVSDCDNTPFRLEYDKWNGSAWPAVWQQVPNTETGDGLYMWGNNTDPFLNNGARTTRLTGSCAVTNGVTLLTSSQIPSLDLPQDGCTVLAWIVRVGNVGGSRFRLRVATEGGIAFTGSYTYAEIEVIDRQAGGF